MEGPRQGAAPARRDPPRRPDPNPARAALAVGGLATLSAIAAAIVAPVTAAPVAAPAAPRGAAVPTPAMTAVQRGVVYVQLAPGQTPPPGATVIQAAAPRPITIVTTVTAPPQRAVVVRTTQSGKVIP